MAELSRVARQEVLIKVKKKISDVEHNLVYPKDL